MTNVLVFLDNFDIGGVTSVVRTIYRGLDRSRFSMDFVRRDDHKNAFDEEITESGDTVYYYQDRGLNQIPVLNYKCRQSAIAKQVIEQIKAHNRRYDAIHIHANPMIGLLIGVKLGIPVRIMHVHEAIPDFGDNINCSKITAWMWKNRRRHYNTWSTVKAGDSKKACIAKFGEQVLKDERMCVLHPPIDMDRFNPENYDEKEAAHLGVDKSEFNIIHVGRLDPIKNQTFLIDILEKLNEETRTHLYIVGDGKSRDKLLVYAKERGMDKCFTIFPGSTTPGLYKLMNCSILPSLSEAFGMVAVESQLMGVPCFASTNVPEDVDIGMCTFLNLNVGASYWAEAILTYDYRSAHSDAAKKKEFEASELLKKLSMIYCGG